MYWLWHFSLTCMRRIDSGACGGVRNTSNPTVGKMIVLQVPERMLKPNLHLALCNLPRQEHVFGPAAYCNELYMERYAPKIDAPLRTAGSTPQMLGADCHDVRIVKALLMIRGQW